MGSNFEIFIPIAHSSVARAREDDAWTVDRSRAMDVKKMKVQVRRVRVSRARVRVTRRRRDV